MTPTEAPMTRRTLDRIVEERAEKNCNNSHVPWSLKDIDAQNLFREAALEQLIGEYADRHPDKIRALIEFEHLDLAIEPVKATEKIVFALGDARHMAPGEKYEEAVAVGRLDKPQTGGKDE
jgi:hypothetical protein